MNEKFWSCYCLVHPKNSTYIGATIDLDHRLRQHNREISGGAKATARLVSDQFHKHSDVKWARICSVRGFPNQTAALQFEWRWKRESHKYRSLRPIDRRLVALNALLKMDRPTKKAALYQSYPDGGPKIYWESEQLSHKMRYYKLNPVLIQLKPKIGTQ